MSVIAFIQGPECFYDFLEDLSDFKKAGRISGIINEQDQKLWSSKTFVTLHVTKVVFNCERNIFLVSFPDFLK